MSASARQAPVQFQANGVVLPVRGRVNVLPPLTAVDDPANNRTKIDLGSVIIGDITGLQGALDAKQDAGSAVTDSELADHIVDTTAIHGIADTSNVELVTRKGAANGYAPLDGGSKIPNTYLPPLALTTPYVAVSQVAQLALDTQEGDVVIRSDLSRSFVRNAGTSGTMADYNELLTPTDSVTSVNGQVGIVSLDPDDVGAAPAAHTHVIADVTNLQSSLDLKQDAATAATDAEVAAHTSSTAVHGIANTADLVLRTLVDAKGDLLVGSAADTLVRRAVGSNGQVLTADSAEADGVKWTTPTVPDLSTTVILAPATSARNVIQPTDPAVKPLIIKAAVDQSTKLFEVQDSAGVRIMSVGEDGWLKSMAGIESAGDLFAAGELYMREGQASRMQIGESGGRAALSFGDPTDIEFKHSASGELQAQGVGAAAGTKLIVKGVASQSSNLQEWQNSTGAVVAGVSKGGALLVGTDPDAFDSGPYAALTIGQPGSAGGLYAVSREDDSKAPFTGLAGYDLGSPERELYFGGGGWGTPDATTLTFYTAPTYTETPDEGLVRMKIWPDGHTEFRATASVTPLVVKGAASQTANLQEWQDSAAVVKGAIKSDGLYKRNGFEFLQDVNDNTTLTTQNSGSAGAQIDLRARGPIRLMHGANPGWQWSQTDNRINVIKYPGIRFEQNYGETGTGKIETDATSGAGLTVTTVARPASTPLVVKGAASQTANIFEVKNSADAVLLRVASSGIIHLSGSGGPYIYPQSGGVKIDDAVMIGGDRYSNAALVAQTNTASYPGAIIRGAASQTADLQQWQNSAGGVLASVSSAGGYIAPNAVSVFGALKGTSAGNIALTLDAGVVAARFLSVATAKPVVTVEGLASQSADLQQWQNSATTVLASVTATGALEMLEQTNPATPAANKGRLYVRDSGAGVTQLVFMGPSGNTVVIAEDF